MIDLSDPISRQQTITALRALSDDDGYINVPHEVVTDVVRGLPPVQAEQGQTTHSEQTKTDKLGVKTGETYKDTISRQDAIKDAESWIAVDEYEKHLQKNVIDWLKEFPSAQQKPLKYSGDSICVYCKTADCDGCIYEPMEGVMNG